MFRKALTALAVLVLAVALAPLAHAQTVDEILTKHFEAQGGLERMRKLQSMRMTGKMAVGPGVEAPFTMEKKRPGRMRLDFTFSGMTGTQAFDGTQGWQVMPFMGKKDPEPLGAEEMKESERQADFDGPLVDWKSKGHMLEYVGKESVEGADTWKLKLTRKDGLVEYYYIDVETGLLLKQTAKRTVRGTEIEGESLFSDYKEVGGLMIAYSMSNGVVGSPQKQTLTFDEIVIDPAIDDARFKMPAVAATAASDSSAATPAKPAAPAAPAAPTKKK